jgi:hypothetical protein
MCTPPSCRHIELHLPEKPTDWPSWEETRTPIAIDQRLQLIVVPICRLSHWVLVVVDLRRHSVSYHNPKLAIRDPAANRIMRLVLRALSLDEVAFTTILQAPACLALFPALSSCCPAYMSTDPTARRCQPP